MSLYQLPPIFKTLTYCRAQASHRVDCRKLKATNKSRRIVPHSGFLGVNRFDDALVHALDTSLFCFYSRGVVIGAAILNNRYQERTRKLDLYKQVYPEKVKIAVTLMQQADSLFQIAYYAATVGDPDDASLKADVMEKAIRLHELSTGAEWLLSKEVKQLCIQLVVAARQIYTGLPERREQVQLDWHSSEPSDGGSGKYHALYAQLGQSVKSQLHISTLDTLLPKQ